MTKEEWKKVEDWWGTGYSSIKMKVDGYDIQLDNNIDKKKMIVEVVIYVDGYIKGAYSTAGNEIGDRFWNRVKKPFYTPKQLKVRAKLWGKRSKEAQYISNIISLTGVLSGLLKSILPVIIKTSAL